MYCCYDFHNYMDRCFKCFEDVPSICQHAYGYIFFLFEDGDSLNLPAGENNLVFNGNSNLKGISHAISSADIIILEPGIYEIHYVLDLGNVTAFIKLNGSKVSDSNYIVDNSSTILYGQTIIKVTSAMSNLNLSINTQSPINLNNAGKDDILFSVLIKRLDCSI
ncbi:hypothetical protein [Clostridium sp. BJN0001]|uniref:hypothetical protein n=1 Tax=Clostridium sp. BJN0001 TaxID=2930219 RepID=UPI001FD5B1B1|nr:hypothetical protein [Clostridium sp. BJN0001]